MKKKIILLSIPTLLVVAGALLFLFGKKETPVVFRTAQTELCELELTVTASGFIQPVTKVDVGTQVSGIVQRLYVDYNSQVEKGQLLAELDKSTLSETVMQRKALVNDAESNRLYAKQNFERVEKLYKEKAATEAQMEEATNKYTTARNAVTNAKANLNQAQVNLGYADIYSPISGRVLNREVDEGQTVAASFNTPTLFTIANDLTKMQIEANVDEADIGRVKLGQKVIFDVDTYPGEHFTGTVEQIRLEPTVTSNVVTYTVIITVPNPEEKLFPGMTANVNITTQSPCGVCISAEALYFTPNPEELKGYTLEQDDSKGNRLWVRNGTGLKAIPVTVGASDGIRSILLTGVDEGREIVLGIERTINLQRGVNILPGPPSSNKKK